MSGNDASAVTEINRLHGEVIQQTADSRKRLNAALVAAWKAGNLLIVERKRVCDAMGGVWGEWLKQSFRGSRGTAQNYIRLAEALPDASHLEGLSLRQTYFRLGIATEPKTRGQSAPLKSLPPHVRLVNKLLAVLKPPTHFRNAEQYAAYRQDLRTLYQRLKSHFEGDKESCAVPLASSVSSRNL